MTKPRYWVKDFLAGLPQTDECILWPGNTNGRYGTVSRKGKKVFVHRLIYEMLVGPIPDDLVAELERFERETRYPGSYGGQYRHWTESRPVDEPATPPSPPSIG